MANHTANQDKRPSIDRRNEPARWLALLGGVIGPVAFFAVYTVAGLLRPGYSPVSQPISDLGIGPNGQLVDGAGVVLGLLLLGFAWAFGSILRQALGAWRWPIVVLLGLRGLTQMTTAIFTEAPATLAIHSTASFVALIVMVAAFLAVGLALLRDRRWSRWGVYSLVAAGVTIVLVVVLFLTFNPNSPLASAHVGGLTERLVQLETYAWFVVFGWRLFNLREERQP